MTLRPPRRAGACDGRYHDPKVPFWGGVARSGVPGPDTDGAVIAERRWP